MFCLWDKYKLMNIDGLHNVSIVHKMYRHYQTVIARKRSGILNKNISCGLERDWKEKIHQDCVLIFRDTK
jgi:hypothetical protein